MQPDLSYISPTTLADLLLARAQHPDAQMVAGGTDVGLWINKLHRQFAQVLDLSRVAELRRIEDDGLALCIGAAVSLSDAFAALVAERAQLHTFATRFASLPVRNSGTLGGNVANGSPIGDAMPLLMALDARVVLMRWQDGHALQRELALADFYTGYRTHVMAADEVLAWIKVPHPTAADHPHPTPCPEGEGVTQTPAPRLAATRSPQPGVRWVEGREWLRVYKVSKRFDDDISAVCLAISLRIKGGSVVHAAIGAGGVAATPVRASQTEAALRGQPWTLATVQQAIVTLRGEFSPLSDLRASSAYREQVLGNLLQRFWLESQGVADLNLENYLPDGDAA